MSKCRLPPIQLDPEIRARWLLPCIHDSDRLARIKHRGEPLPTAPLPQYELTAEFDRRGMRLSGRMVLELCCGLGDFLCQLATLEPDARYTGVDYARPVAERAARQAGKLGLDNALIYLGRLEDFFDHDCHTARFDLVMINFPDPWPKKRHRKRRVVQPPLIPRLERALKPGGLLVTATDVRELHEEHAAMLSTSTLLEWMNPVDRETPPLPCYQRASRFESKGRAVGRAVSYTVHRLRGA